MTKSGFIALIGRPNVGKSTLLNFIIGQKISITSKKPQTTRHKISGVKTIDDVQLVFVDTPGIHNTKGKAMNRYLNKTAQSVVNDVDAIVFMVDGFKWTDEDELVFNKIKESKIPIILGINKVDEIKDKERLLPYLQKMSNKFNFHEIIPLSAKKGVNTDGLEKILSDIVPEGPHFFAEEQVTDRSDKFRIAEIIREKLTRFLGQELPYSLTVEIESFKKAGDRQDISAIIWVERQSQKKIVIGSQGSSLKEIGTQARLAMNDIFNCSVHLQLWVKVREGWSNDERALQSLGYLDLDK